MKIKRVLSSLLATAMSLGMMSTGAFAEETSAKPEDVLSTGANYSNAVAGENEYISCIVTNSDGKTVTISDALIKGKMPESALFRE